MIQTFSLTLRASVSWQDRCPGKYLYMVGYFLPFFSSTSKLKPCLDTSWLTEGGIPTVVSGRVSDLLNNATDTGKILNGLDFPMYNSSLDINAFATDLAAWDVTRGLHHLDPGASYPTEDMAWGLCGHKHCFTFVHVDAEGCSTRTRVECGEKAWGVIEDSGALKLSSIDFFLDAGFRLNEVLKTSKYDMELIILKPGDTMCVLSAFWELLLSFD